jgi:phosphohistidine phosphatase SixA
MRSGSYVTRRPFLLLLAGLALGRVATAEPESDEGLWSALKSGGYVVFIRHAITEAGVGDPAGFTLGDCSTQRNLSAQGRADAQRIGKAFRDRGVPIHDVLSSRWCRCIDTARLAFGRVTPSPMLDSMFVDAENVREKKVRATLATVATRRTDAENLILVTHARNILALTGVSPGSGEMVVAVLQGTDRFKVIGRLERPGE